MEKFLNVPVEDDTVILVSLGSKLGERDVLYQKWVWDGITGESLIFVSDDVASLSDGQLEADVRTSPLVGSGSVTISRSDSGYTFVNFNFVVGGDEDHEPEVLTPDELKEKRMKTLSSIGKANAEAVKNIKKSRGS